MKGKVGTYPLMKKSKKQVAVSTLQHVKVESLALEEHKPTGWQAGCASLTVPGAAPDGLRARACVRSQLNMCDTIDTLASRKLRCINSDFGMNDFLHVGIWWNTMQWQRKIGLNDILWFLENINFRWITSLIQ